MSAHRMTRRGARAALLAGVLGAFAGCSLVQQRAREQAPQGRPGGDEGMLLYTVGRMTFEAPAGWEARGDARQVTLVSPANDARIYARLVDRTFQDDAKCLADAEQALAGGKAGLTNVRRHGTTLAGRKAVVQEADQDRWHGWAWAACDGGEQYRLWFSGLSPLSPEHLRAVRLLSSSAVLAPRTSTPARRPHGTALALRTAGGGR